jgi:polyphosphate kinase
MDRTSQTLPAVVAGGDQAPAAIGPGDAATFLNRELSWLAFARRVLALVEDPEVPLLERVKFLGIMGMLHDEFFMKRISGLKRQVARGVQKQSIDGRTPSEELFACREEILGQAQRIARLVKHEIRPALAREGFPIRDWSELSAAQKKQLQQAFADAVMPILTPLAVDAEHPFPFISSLGLNLAIELRESERERFVRIKVPANRDRWLPTGDGGVVPLEQVIAANLKQLFPREKGLKAYAFRVTRGVEGETPHHEDDGGPPAPGSIVEQGSEELKARRFAGIVRLQVAPDMPQRMRGWLARQLGVEEFDVYEGAELIGLADFLKFGVDDRDELRDPPHQPATHPRLRGLDSNTPGQFFERIRQGDILLHHPYHNFDTSVLRLLECAATDPQVLAIKLTIYRTSKDSPIVRALLEAARAGKQVAVLVEITARLDEAPNIAWGRLLEREGVHVAYGVEKLKTHVKLALVVREEPDGLRRYVHVGTGNYHTGTARLYTDLGLLSCERELADDVAALFNELTGAMPYEGYRRLVVAPYTMRAHFVGLIDREIDNARAGRPSGIRAKINQLQDPGMIRALYRASQAGVPIVLDVRGLCCLRPGVPGLSETIRVFSVVGRFLEHARLYRFENAGSPEFFIGSADWMKRNLDNRIETIAPVADARLREQCERLLAIYDADNCSACDLHPDGSYVRRQPSPGEERRAAQEQFILQAKTFD